VSESGDSVLTGATATVIAAENDNDLSTYDATSFYQKLDQERGGQ
jgi:hypothetical protein